LTHCLLYAIIINREVWGEICVIFDNLRLPNGKGWERGLLAVSDGVFAEPTADMPHHDCGGCMALPGFIDTHIHGAFGVSFDALAPEGLLQTAKYLAQRGTTSFLAAVTCTGEDVLQSIRMAAAAMDVQNDNGCARMLGIHLEGPFLSPKKPGAFSADSIRSPSVEFLYKCAEAAGGKLRIMTAAPELDGMDEVAAAAKKLGIILSMGHSDADFETASAAAADFGRATHLFNAMRGFTHRDPGIAAAALLDDSLICEIICDFVHLHPAAIRLALASAGASRLCMVSDAMSCAGLSDGVYTFGGREYTLRDRTARFADGTICGSAATLADGVKNLLCMGVSPADVAEMSSRTPARSLGIAGGTFDIGSRADFVLLDSEYNVAAVYIGGKEVVMEGR